MATRHSSRRPSSERSGLKRPTPPAPSLPPAAASAASRKGSGRSATRAEGKKKAARPPDFDEILGHFAEALALAETAYSALDVAQEDCSTAISPAVLTLKRGLRELGCVYTELDRAILRQG